MTVLAGSTMVCHECDLVVDVPDLELDARAFCPRCEYLLAANRPHALTTIFAFAIAALVFLILATLFPFISLSASGQEQSVTLPGSIAVLFDQDHVALSGVVFGTIIGIPAALLAGVVYLSIAIRLDGGLPGMGDVLRLVLRLLPWSMAEIFLIGILVSFVKIVSLADVELGRSFWAYVLFTICLVVVVLNLDRRELWRQVWAAQSV